MKKWKSFPKNMKFWRYIHFKSLTILLLVQLTRPNIFQTGRAPSLHRPPDSHQWSDPLHQKSHSLPPFTSLGPPQPLMSLPGLRNKPDPCDLETFVMNFSYLHSPSLRKSPSYTTERRGDDSVLTWWLECPSLSMYGDFGSNSGGTTWKYSGTHIWFSTRALYLMVVI